MMFNKQGNDAGRPSTENGGIDEQVANGRPNPPTILLVGDDPALLALLDEWLAAEGYAVVQDSPPAARTKARTEATTERRVDLVIVDVAFPRRGCAKVLQPLKQQYPQTPVLALSATFVGRVDSHGSVADALGVACVLPKPLSREGLLAALASLLGDRGGDRGDRSVPNRVPR